MYTRPYKNQTEEKENLKHGDWILFQENKSSNILWSGEVIAVDRQVNTIVVCTDIDNKQLDDFSLVDIVLHIDSEWEGFEDKADLKTA